MMTDTYADLFAHLLLAEPEKVVLRPAQAATKKGM
jgi:hypothetical protein